MGDLKIRRKKEQGRGAGRYYEQCANRVRGFSPPRLVALPLFLSLFLSLFCLCLKCYSSGPSTTSVLFLFIIQWGQEVLVN